jgi:hypothetical protein
MASSSVRFEDILDNCIGAMQTGEQSVKSCLARHPEQREELEPLLRLAHTLSAARAVTAPESFRSTAVARMTNLVAARPRQARGRVGVSVPGAGVWRKVSALFRRPVRVSLATLLGFLLALTLVIGSGMGYASASALPGDALYAVKLMGERARLAVSLDAAGDARLRLRFADRRLDEVSALLAENRPADVAPALENYATQVSWAMALLAHEDGSPTEAQVALADRMTTELTEHESWLAALLAHLPQDAWEAADLALAASQTGRRRALAVLSAGPGVPQRDPATPEGLFDSPLPTNTSTPTATVSPTATPSPTPSPTSTRTATPTSTPSPSPTRTPWIVPPLPTPWPKPTRWPTRLPTAWPTEWPTEWPTGVPTEWPSEWPTGVPTEWPTDVPIPVPTPPPPPDGFNW